MGKTKFSFKLDWYERASDVGASYDDIATPCSVCVYSEKCFEALTEDDPLCDLAQRFEALLEEFNAKVQVLLKDELGKGA